MIEPRRIKGKPTPKNYPNYISDNAIMVWEDVCKKYKTRIEKEATLAMKWRVALVLFRKACAREGVMPFIPNGMTNDNVSDALNFLNRNAVRAKKLLDDVAAKAKELALCKTFNIRDLFDIINHDRNMYVIELKRKATLMKEVPFLQLQQMLGKHFSFTKTAEGSIKVIDPTLRIKVIYTGGDVYAITQLYLTQAQVDQLTGDTDIITWARKWKASKKVVAEVTDAYIYENNPTPEEIDDITDVFPPNFYVAKEPINIEEVLDIKSRDDLIKAQITWGLNVLMNIGFAERNALAQKLLEYQKQYNVDIPSFPVWYNIVKEPYYYDDLALHPPEPDDFNVPLSPDELDLLMNGGTPKEQLTGMAKVLANRGFFDLAHELAELRHE